MKELIRRKMMAFKEGFYVFIKQQNLKIIIKSSKGR